MSPSSAGGRRIDHTPRRHDERKEEKEDKGCSSSNSRIETEKNLIDQLEEWRNYISHVLKGVEDDIRKGQWDRMDSNIETLDPLLDPLLSSSISFQDDDDDDKHSHALLELRERAKGVFLSILRRGVDPVTRLQVSVFFLGAASK